MGKLTENISGYIKGQTAAAVFGVCATATLVACVAFAVWYFNKDNSISMSADRKIDITPAQIQAIRDIGQWEFMSISDEELVDTVERGFFRDKELVRIYYGTLRIGTDLSKAKPGWITAKDSSVTVELPPIELLDSNFIDEAHTRAFFETGSWTAKEREALYRKAYDKMLARCMTKENIAIAGENARKQFTRLMNSIGFKNVTINIKDN